MEHFFSPTERRTQLVGLVAALDDLIPVLAVTPGYGGRVPEFAAALVRARSLLDDGFEQADLSELARAVPSLFHPRWEPPLERTADGSWQEADWYRSLADKLEPALAAAETLRTIGYRA